MCELHGIHGCSMVKAKKVETAMCIQKKSKSKISKLKSKKSKGKGKSYKKRSSFKKSSIKFLDLNTTISNHKYKSRHL